MALGFQLTDDDDREDHFVLVEAQYRAGIGEQNAGVEDVGSPPLGRTAAFAVRH